MGLIAEFRPRNLAKRLIRRSYALQRATGLLRLTRDARAGEPLLVYQMGKVGSLSLTASLKGCWHGPVYHLHTLSEKQLQAEERVYRRLVRHRGVPAHIVEGIFLRHRISRLPFGKKWRVVTLVRDPVARNISDFFQNLDAQFKSLGFEGRIRAGGDTRLVSDMLAAFTNDYPHLQELDWFDRELKAHLGIDVFATPFSRERGWQIYENDRSRTLVIRTEDLDQVVAGAIEAFVGLSTFLLRPRNIGTSKYYATVYDQFLDQVGLSPELLEEVYSSRLSRHFYSPDEIARFRARWVRSSAPVQPPTATSR